jgi:sec-independent protein translocase protein TatB
VFGISGEKLLILGLIAIFVLGPERLPHYAQQLARLVKSLRRMAEGAKGQLQNELGEDVNWKQLDPRQYDPRRIIREALAETDPVVNPVSGLNRPVVREQPKLEKGEVPPFDTEAT